MSAQRPLSPRLMVLCLILLTVAGLALVTGRDLGYRFTLAACSGMGQCGEFPESPPVCQYFGRDRVAAQESFVFAQQQVAAGARLIRFGDDSAEIIATSDGAAPGAVYTFGHWHQAQRWVLDHSAELGGVIDAAAGPAGQPIRDGYMRALRAAGLDHEITVEPTTAVQLIEEGLPPGSLGALSGKQGEAVQEMTFVMPFESASDELLRLAQGMGFWGFLSYTVELDDELQPLALTFSGPAADGWSLQSLRSAAADNFFGTEDRPLLGLDDGQVVVRSFTLDLQSQANAAVYRELFSMEPIHQAIAAAPLLSGEERLAAQQREDLYERLLHRIRDDAVAVDAVHALPGARGEEEQILRAAQGLLVRLGPGDAPNTRLVDARTADLSVAGSELEPLLSCEIPDPEEGP